MDKARQERVTRWGTELVALAGPLEVRGGQGETEIVFHGEPIVIPLESAGVARATIESKPQLQMLMAALMYERAQSLIRRADELMKSSHNME